jgi:hypothetical protein
MNSMKNFLIALGNRRVFSLIGLFSLLIALPLTVSVSMEQQTTQQEAAELNQSGNQFSVKGKVFIDSNKNSSQETNELGYANASVTLTYADGSEPVIVTSDSEGNYVLSGDKKGSVIVSVVMPRGFIATNQESITLLTPSDIEIHFGITPIR